MNLIPKKNSLFDDEYTTYVPSEGEVRIVANRNKQCAYYFLGIDQCRKRMLKLAGDPSNENHSLGFLPCKRLVDAHYRCLTEEKYGYTLEEAPEVAKQQSEAFYTCAFKNLLPMSKCRQYFDGVLRSIYRQPENELNDNY